MSKMQGENTGLEGILRSVLKVRISGSHACRSPESERGSCNFYEQSYVESRPVIIAFPRNMSIC